MTLNLFLGTLLRYWYALVAGALLGALVGLAVTRLMPETYEASSTVLLSAPRTADPLDGATYLESRMPTYAELSTSRPVLDRAAEAWGVPISRDVLARKVAAVVPESTSLVVLTARWSDPRGAADLANAVSEAFVGLAPRLDNPDRPALQVEVLEEALPPDGPAGLPAILWMALGGVLGLTAVLMCALLAAALAAGARPKPGDEHVSSGAARSGPQRSSEAGASADPGAKRS